MPSWASLREARQQLAAQRRLYNPLDAPHGLPLANLAVRYARLITPGHNIYPTVESYLMPL